jgi:hypothetical protein
VNAQRAGSATLRKLSVCLALALATLLAAAGGAAADGFWRISALVNPVVVQGTQVQYVVDVVNFGDRPIPEATGGNSSNCVPGAPAPADPSKCWTVTATFPAGITPVSASGVAGSRLGGAPCTVDGGTNSITCAVSGHNSSKQLTPPGGVNDGQAIFVGAVDPAASGSLTTSFEVAGAGVATDATVAAVTAGADAPDFGVGAFDGQVTADAAGDPFTQAGGHPYEASTAVVFNSVDDDNLFIGTLWPVEATKDVLVDLPPGFVGNPTVVDQCTGSELANSVSFTAHPLCPPTSQVGTTFVYTNTLGSGSSRYGPVPVFSMEPPPGVPARFGFNVAGTVVTLDAELRSAGDYGLSVNARGIPEGLAIQGTQLTLWGVPSDPSHDAERACPGDIAPAIGGPTCASGAPLKPFLRNPTMCTADGVGLPTTAHIDSWAHPGVFTSATFESHLPPAYPSAPGDWGRPQGPTGCDRVPFDPRLAGTPAAGARAGEPSGFSFDLTLPQDDNPNGVGESDLKKTVVTLPEGVRVNPSSADGLEGCSSAQIALHSTADPTCPDGSKIGDITVDTPLLDEQLTGGIYLAAPFDNPFNSLVAVYLVARGSGVIIKLPGEAQMDPGTGQITTTFDDNPQTPFSRLHLEFKGGPRAPLSLPSRCGTYTTHAVMTGWSGATATSDSSFTLSQDGDGLPCPSGFSPGFSAGTESSGAGKSSPFHLRLTREDSDQELKSLTVGMPEGLLGYVSRAVLCAGAAANAGTCGGGSLIGHVTVGAGAGTNPFYVGGGTVHITGPYKGAPFGLSIVVPAVAGPFDLGTVVVRGALYVDKHDSTLRVVTDPLPTILQGIPLNVRDVRVSIDRDGFMVNPTSCAEKSVSGTVGSTEGATANVSSRFQAFDCASLAVRPTIRLFAGKRGRTYRNASTPLTVVVKNPASGASNLRYTKVSLPTTINARLDVVNRACTRDEFEAGHCSQAKAGTAYVITPLLRDPLRGGVYFVKNGRALPDLFIALRGQVDFDLIGKVSIPGGKHLATTLDAVPDVPFTKFVLRLVAGKHGPVGAATNLCTRTGHRTPAAVDFVGQNGKVLQVDQRMHIRGCRSKAAKARARRARARRAAKARHRRQAAAQRRKRGR